MNADVATPKSTGLAGHAEGSASAEEPAASPPRHAPASPDEEGAPTPFYDHLMTMIEATALESRSAPYNDDDDAAPPIASHRWRTLHPITFAAGLIVVIAAGGAVLRSGASQRQPAVVAADSAPEEASRVVVNATTAVHSVERPLPAAEPDARRSIIGDEGKQTAESGIGAGPASVAKPDQPPVVTAVAGHPIENLGRGTEPRSDGPEKVQPSAEATSPEPIAPTADRASAQPPPADTPQWLTTARETGSTGDQADAHAASLPAWIVSDVNMRAGPSNGQAVVATIPRGSPVEVIDCRQWCEVIFTGQRGWVYRSFVDVNTNP
jgi:hypothetical protein